MNCLNSEKRLIFVINHFIQSSLLPFISKKETPQETTFNIDTPPRVGFYKLMIYAVRRPRRPGKLKIPLIATFLIDYRHRQDNLELNLSAFLFKGMQYDVIVTTKTCTLYGCEDPQPPLPPCPGH